MRNTKSNLRPLPILGLAIALWFTNNSLLAWETPETEAASKNQETASVLNHAPQDAASTRASAPAKIYRYVERIFQRHDKDLDGVLAPDEWLGMRGYPILIAGSAEEVITKEQLIDYVTTYGHRRRIRLLFSPMKQDPPAPTLLHPSENGPGDNTQANVGVTNHATNESFGSDKQFYIPTGRFPPGLPSWFFARDANGDGQLSLPEFAVNGTQNSTTEFDKLDIDNDGILSPHDLVKIAPKKASIPKAVTKKSSTTTTSPSQDAIAAKPSNTQDATDTNQAVASPDTTSNSTEDPKTEKRNKKRKRKSKK